MDSKNLPDSVSLSLYGGPQDADEAISVMHRAFDEYTAKGLESGAMRETPQTLRAELDDGWNLATVRLGSEMVAICKHRIDGDTIYFGRLAVVPEARGRGIASRVVESLRKQSLAQGLSGLSCCVRADEAANIALYQRLGMEIVSSGTRGSRTGATIEVVNMRDRLTEDAS